MPEQLTSVNLQRICRVSCRHSNQSKEPLSIPSIFSTPDCDTNHVTVGRRHVADCCRRLLIVHWNMFLDAILSFVLLRRPHIAWCNFRWVASVPLAVDARSTLAIETTLSTWRTFSCSLIFSLLGSGSVIIRLPKNVAHFITHLLLPCFIVRFAISFIPRKLIICWYNYVGYI